eukprot:jgi/Chlat1/8562/Chrsp82S07953
MAPALIVDTLLSWIIWPSSLLYLSLLAPPLFLWRWFTHSSIVAPIFAINPRNRVALITGASSGIGRELSKEFARRGTKLFLCARREQELHDIAREATQLGSPEVGIRVTDVSREDECKDMVMSCVERFGRLDFLCLNAGVGHRPLFFEEESSTEGFRDVFDVDFWGAVYPTHYALDPLKRTRGQILVTASVAGLLPWPRQALYNAAKAAAVNFFDTVRVELSGVVGVTIACPGWVDAGLTEGRAVAPEQLQEMKGPLPVTRARSVSKAMIDGALIRKRFVIYPSWYATLLANRVFAPEVLDLVLRMFFVPVDRRSASLHMGGGGGGERGPGGGGGGKQQAGGAKGQ